MHACFSPPTRTRASHTPRTPHPRAQTHAAYTPHPTPERQTLRTTHHTTPRFAASRLTHRSARRPAWRRASLPPPGHEHPTPHTPHPRAQNHVPHTPQVPEETRMEACFSARMENYKKDQTVYRIGEQPERFHLILTGGCGWGGGNGATADIASADCGGALARATHTRAAIPCHAAGWSRAPFCACRQQKRPVASCRFACML